MLALSAILHDNVMGEFEWQPVEAGLVIVLLSFDIMSFVSLFPFSKFITYMIYLLFGSRNGKICLHLLFSFVAVSDKQFRYNAH